MTRKDYRAIAAIVYETHKEHSCDTEPILIAKLVDYIESANPNFDRSKFIAACLGE